jgi:uncharacterized protein (DUF58 family)
MTRHFWLLIVLILGFILTGLLSVNNGPILLTIPLLVYLGIAVFFKPRETLLKVSRELSTHDASLGKPIEIKVHISNDGEKLEEVLLSDYVQGPRSLQVSHGKLSQRLSMMSDGMTEIAYTVSGLRGRYRFEGVQAQVSDFFNLFEDVRFFAAHAQLVIFPELIQLHTIKIRPRQTRGFAGPILARQGGAGTDFFGVREYQVGDPLRRINWKISTRYPQSLFTNESEQERIADVGLILDARQQCDVSSQGDTLFEHSVIAAASLADAFLRDGHRVGLYIYGYSVERVYPGYGKIQREHILRALSRARTGINFALENLSFLSTRFFPPNSQLVMVSPLKTEDFNPLVRLHSTGYEIMIVSPNPVHFESARYNPQKYPGLDLSIRLAMIERTLMIRKLKRSGIQVIDWQVDQSLDRVVSQAIRQQPNGQRILQIAS